MKNSMPVNMRPVQYIAIHLQRLLRHSVHADNIGSLICVQAG